MTQRTWTEHTSTCRGCVRRFRISQEAITLWRETQQDYFTQTGEPAPTDAEIAEGFDFCLACAAGEKHDDEHVTPQQADGFREDVGARRRSWSSNPILIDSNADHRVSQREG